MIKYSLKRILELIPTVFVVVFIVFVVTRVIPGDPAAVMLGPQASVEAVEELRENLGLNDSIAVQFGRYLKGVVHGDLGKSYYYNQPVTKLISERFPNTLVLAVISIIIGLLIGIPVGVVSATKQYSVFDYISMILALVGISVPIFWLAMMAVLLFSVNLGWLPSVGMGEGGLIDIIKHLILPSLCLATGPTATFARFTRSSMLDITKQDYIKTAHAKGLKEKLVIWRHAFKNALPPIITIAGMQFSSLLSGAVLTETIFSWPGLGKLIVDAIQNRDYTLVQGSVVYMAFVYIIVNLAVDICYAFLNPKVKASFEGNGGGEG
ncbi:MULTISPECIES: nickel ABC transporter permease [Tissierellales]|uniref:Nickel import system permease protein NikB n=1 Tax=Acidilutibacter cellobiosedens TaxID=2507161 RepID=A0A410Q8W8_9FIRM|nr:MULTISPECIES: nickel ABC transporter permease [Tissierellales]MBE6082998.1 ABC transporter permease [Tissierellaceae bacterium]QAT60411.1 ABC transporter permease [Acidilutibacter cellobiosedens]SCL88515.1 Glutathione transport system permease protein GsiC [Sporanaerobacter sp. PP17-6a]